MIHTPHLLPTPKYVADHTYQPQLGEAEKARWLELLADADILFDFDWLRPSVCRKRCTAALGAAAPAREIGEFLERTGLARSSILITTAAGVHASALAEFTLLGLLYFGAGSRGSWSVRQCIAGSATPIANWPGPAFWWSGLALSGERSPALLPHSGWKFG